MWIQTGRDVGRRENQVVGVWFLLGDTPVRGWSSNQAVIAFSSGEAEYYAALEGASAALGYQSMLRDVGIDDSVTLFTDSSAARGIIHRAGLGKLCHLETGYLCLQAAVAGKRLQARKMLGGKPSRPVYQIFVYIRHVEASWDTSHCS